MTICVASSVAPNLAAVYEYTSELEVLPRIETRALRLSHQDNQFPIACHRCGLWDLTLTTPVHSFRYLRARMLTKLDGHLHRTSINIIMLSFKNNLECRLRGCYIQSYHVHLTEISGLLRASSSSTFRTIPKPPCGPLTVLHSDYPGRSITFTLRPHRTAQTSNSE